MKRIVVWCLTAAALTCLVVGSVVGSSGPGGHERVPPSPRLDLHELKDTKGVPGYALTAYIQADAGAVWRIIADTARVHDIFPDVRSQRVGEKNTGRPAASDIVWKYTLATPIGDKVLQVRVQEDADRMTLQWERVSGDLAAFEGYGSVARCEEYPGYCKLEYNHFVDAGGLTPQFMTNRTNKSDLLQLVPNIEQLLEDRAKQVPAASPSSCR